MKMNCEEDLKKSIKTYYADLPNMGDLLNVLLIERYFGYSVKRRTFLTAELSGIGSGLGQFILSEKPRVAAAQSFFGKLYPKVFIWGTGYINNNVAGKFYRKNICFKAVRGELSKKRVEEAMGRKMDIPTGDAGILASHLIEKPVIKNYSVGIIPHYKELSEPIFQQLANQFDNSIIIDVTKDPLEVVKLISSCEVILSSSLHGLIVADSFHIPNVHIVVTNKLLGDGFKFDDYYSAYGCVHFAIDLNYQTVESLEFVEQRYQITQQMVEQKKLEMIQAFPFPRLTTPQGLKCTI
jgi:hypothetical protein